MNDDSDERTDRQESLPRMKRRSPFDEETERRHVVVERLTEWLRARAERLHADAGRTTDGLTSARLTDIAKGLEEAASDIAQGKDP
jgi:hypothetical protein